MNRSMLENKMNMTFGDEANTTININSKGIISGSGFGNQQPN